MPALLEQLSTAELEEAVTLVQSIQKGLVRSRRRPTQRLKNRLSGEMEKKLRKMFSLWEEQVMGKLPKVKLAGESLTAEVVKNYELALADLPTYNKLAKKYYNEKPRTVRDLRERYQIKIDGLVSLSGRKKSKLLEQIEGMKPVEKRHPGALGIAVAVSVDPNPLEQIMAESLEIGVVEGGRFTYKDMGEKPAFFALKDPKAIAWINDQSFLFAEHTASRFTQQLHWRTIKAGLDEGLSMPHVKKALQEQFTGLRSKDAVRIARTATAQAVEYGRFEGMVELGVKYGQVVNGPNPCDECADLAARGSTPIEELRGVVPAHPLCVCDVVAVA